MATGAKSETYVEGFADSPEHYEFSKYTFPMTEYKKDKATIHFLNFFTDLQNRANSYCKRFENQISILSFNILLWIRYIFS